MIQIFKQRPKVDYLAKKYYLITLSTIFVLVSLLSLGYQGLNLGLDFRGGTQVQIRFPSEVPEGELRSLFDQGLGTTVSLTKIGGILTHDYLLIYRAAAGSLQSGDVQSQIQSILKSAKLDAQVLRSETIGPKIGAELRQNAAYMVLLSLLLVLIYMAFRFNIPFGLGAIVALFHDTLVTIGAFSLFRVEFDLTALAGILTLIGYSLNDTIVIFDRVRENIKRHPGKPLAELINLSVNETMSRTILIFLTTFMIILAMFVFGGESIRGFSFTFLVGMVVGTYSSVFIASPIAMWVRGFEGHFRKKPVAISSSSL